MAGLGGSGTGSNYIRANSTGPAASATGANAAAIGSGSNASGADSLAFGTNAQATQSGAIAMGLNSSSTGVNAIAIGTGASATGSVAVGAAASAANGGAAFGDGATATGSLSTALGPNASATAANSVAIGSGSTNTVANTVSFGSAGNERRLTNVAAGINPTDAVNVGQLQSVAAGFQSQLGGLQSQINDTRWEARGGVALALAASGLRYDDRPGKLSLAGAFGNFKGESRPRARVGVCRHRKAALQRIGVGGAEPGQRRRYRLGIDYAELRRDPKAPANAAWFSNSVHPGGCRGDGDAVYAGRRCSRAANSRSRPVSEISRAAMRSGSAPRRCCTRPIATR